MGLPPCHSIENSGLNILARGRVVSVDLFRNQRPLGASGAVSLSQQLAIALGSRPKAICNRTSVQVLQHQPPPAFPQEPPPTICTVRSRAPHHPAAGCCCAAAWRSSRGGGVAGNDLSWCNKQVRCRQVLALPPGGRAIPAGAPPLGRHRARVSPAVPHLSQPGVCSACVVCAVHFQADLHCR